MEKSPCHHTCHADNAPGQHLVAIAEEQKPVQGMRQRSHKAESLNAPSVGSRIHMLQGRRMLLHVTDIPTQPPCRNHAQADNTASRKHGKIAPLPAPCIPGRQQQHQAESSPHQATRQWQRPASSPCHHLGQQGGRTEADVHAIEPPRTSHRRDALERCKSRDRNDQQNDQ
ncbi:hypothetical protein D3C72_1757220 [compost metagenome]